MEISQELLSQYKLSPYRNWCCNINQNDLSDLLDVLSKMKPTQEKTKIGIEINENNLNLKKTENDIFDNNYYKIKYKLSQNEYD